MSQPTVASRSTPSVVPALLAAALAAGCGASWAPAGNAEPEGVTTTGEAQELSGGLSCRAAKAALPALYNLPIRFGTEGAFPPFNYVDSMGVLAGWEMDYLTALCTAMGVPCSTAQHPWGPADGTVSPGTTSLFNELLNTQSIDAIIAGIAPKPERLQWMDFSEAYANDLQTYVVQAGNTTFDPDVSVAAKVVATQEDTFWEDYLMALPGATVVTSASQCPSSATGPCVLLTSDLPAAVALVTSGGAEAVLTAASSVFVEVGNGTLKKVGAPIADSAPGVVIAVRRSASAPLEGLLRRSIDCAIEELDKAGTFETINQRYFDVLLPPP